MCVQSIVEYGGCAGLVNILNTADVIDDVGVAATTLELMYELCYVPEGQVALHECGALEATLHAVARHYSDTRVLTAFSQLIEVRHSLAHRARPPSRSPRGHGRPVGSHKC